MIIANLLDITVLNQDMSTAIQELDYWALGYFQQVIESRKKVIEAEQDIKALLYLCHTGKDYYEEELTEFKHLWD